MNETKVIPPVYQDQKEIDIHIDIYPYGLKYQIDPRGVGGRSRKFINMLPDDLHQMNEHLRGAFRTVAEENNGQKSLLKLLAEEGHRAFLKIFDAKDTQEGFLKLLSYSERTVIEITTDNFFLPWELLSMKILTRSSQLIIFWEQNISYLDLLIWVKRLFSNLIFPNQHQGLAC